MGVFFLKDEILAAAKNLLGERAGNEAALEAMCGAAEDEFLSRLREEAVLTDIRERFIGASAVLAMSLYMQIGDSEDWSSFRAGNVSVSRRGSGSARSSASALRKQAESMLSGCLEDNGFDFRGVCG